MSEISMAYTEVYSILTFIDEYYVNKISAKFIEYLYKKKDNNYIPQIDMSLPLEEQNLLEDTINILALIKYNYWCENEKERQELIKILNENEQKYQENLREKYNPENVFDKKEIPIKMQMIQYKESVFRHIINKIKAILRIGK